MAARKTTTRTPRSKKPEINDSETLKDDQEVKQNAEETLGSIVAPANIIYQTSQFNNGPHPDTLAHLAEPPAAAKEARDASDNYYKNYGKKGEGK